MVQQNNGAKTYNTHTFTHTDAKTPRHQKTPKDTKTPRHQDNHGTNITTPIDLTQEPNIERQRQRKKKDSEIQDKTKTRQRQDKDKTKTRL